MNLVNKKLTWIQIPAISYIPIYNVYIYIIYV